MDTAQIRRNFVAHFENDTRWGAHTAVPSASLLPHGGHRELEEGTH